MKKSLIVLFLLALLGCKSKPVEEGEITVQKGELVQRVSYKGKTGAVKRAVALPEGKEVWLFEATLSLSELVAKEVMADAQIELLYQDPKEPKSRGLTIARLHIRNKGAGVTLEGALIECQDEECKTYFKSSVTGTPFGSKVEMNKEHLVGVAYDSKNRLFFFRFDDMAKTMKAPDEFNEAFFKTGRLGVSVKNLGSRSGEGAASATWDSVKVNGILYDSFDANAFEKWVIVEK